MHINYSRGETRGMVYWREGRHGNGCAHAGYHKGRHDSGRYMKQRRHAEYRMQVKQALGRDPTGEIIPRWLFKTWYD